MNGIIKITEQEILASEKERIDFYNKVEISAEKPNVLKVMFRGVEVGQLVLSVADLEFNPKGGFRTNLVVRNITPLI